MNRHHHAGDEKATATRRRKEQAAPEAHAAPDAGQTLQRSVGNQAVQQLIERQRLQLAQNQAAAEDLTPISGEMQQRIDGLRDDSGGRGLDPAARARFEPSAGADFGGVRLHEGPAVDRTARDLHARAFTQGSDVFLGERGNLGIQRERFLEDDAALEVLPSKKGSSVEFSMDFEEAVQKLRAALEAVIAQPKTREAFERFGAEVVPNTAEEFTRRLEEDYARWTRIRKETGLKFD